MPGRCKGMARKAATVETVVLNVFRRISAATPAIHKEPTPRHGVSAPTSPWVAVYRLGCELLLATAELGEHYRKRAGIREAGPIRTVFNKAELRRLREKYQRAASGRTLCELASLHIAANQVCDDLPISADPIDESCWAFITLHDPSPDFNKAPSQIAISLWHSLEKLGPGFTSSFLRFMWRTRIRLEGLKEAAAAESLRKKQACEEADHALMDRLYGPDWRKATSIASNTESPALPQPSDRPTGR